MAKRIPRGLKHPPYRRFQGFLAENNIRLQDIAEVIGTTKSTVSLKNNGQSDYSATEIFAICDAFGCDPCVFRTQKVS